METVLDQKDRVLKEQILGTTILGTTTRQGDCTSCWIAVEGVCWQRPAESLPAPPLNAGHS